MQVKKTNSKKPKNNFIKIMKIIVPTFIILLVVVLLLEVTNTTHFFHTQKLSPLTTTSIKNNKANTKTGQVNQSSNMGSTNTNTKSPSPTSSNSSEQTTGLTLVAPYGDFVSNHRPTSSTGFSEVSVCDTTPGAQCYIEFSNGQVSTQLPTQTADDSGAASWNWNVMNNSQLSSGSWQITAVSTLESNTKSTTDQINLVIP